MRHIISVPRIGPIQAVALYVGAIVGSGVLILPTYAAAAAGPASIVAWLLIAALSLPLAMTYAALAARYPDKGGLSAFIHRAFGPAWGLVAGLTYYAVATIGQAIVALTGGTYLAMVLGLGQPTAYGVAVLLLGLSILLNTRGTGQSSAAQVVLSTIVCVVLLLTIALALPLIHMQRFMPFAPHGLGAIGQAGSLILWSFFGWEVVTHLAPDFRNPRRDLPRATVLAVLLVGVIYVGLAVVMIGAAPVAGNQTGAPLASLLARSIGMSAALATVAIALLLCVSTMNTSLAGAAQLATSLSRLGALPRWVGPQPGSRTGTMRPQLVTTTLSLVTLMYLALGGTLYAALLLSTALSAAINAAGMLAALRLLDGSRAKWQAGLGLLLCGLAMLFAGPAMLAVPAIAGVAYLAVRPRQGVGKESVLVTTMERVTGVLRHAERHTAQPCTAGE